MKLYYLPKKIHSLNIKITRINKKPYWSAIATSGVISKVLPIMKELLENMYRSVGMYVQRCYDESKSEYKSYRQTDPNSETPQRWFVKQLKLLHSEIGEMIRNIAPMTNVQTKEFATASICHICEKPFNEENKHVKDHCNISGLYR